MGLAGVQNDCKTKLIPNIWKNEEEKGRGTCKALAAADVWGTSVRLRSWGWGGGMQHKGMWPSLPDHACPAREKETAFSLNLV